MDKDQHITPEEFEEVERFLQHEMPAEEERAFSIRIAAEPDLQNKIERMKFIFTGIQEASLEKKLDSFHEELSADLSHRPDATGKLFSLKKWLVAASVIAIVTISSWLVFFKTNKEDNLFADYFQPDPGLISAMSSGPDNYTFDRAMIDYKTGNYDTAINSWKVLLRVNPNSDTLNYFIASAYLAKRESHTAIPYFQKVISVKREAFLSEAYWYLGLSLLKERKITEAIPFLEKSTRNEKESLLSRLTK